MTAPFIDRHLFLRALKILLVTLAMYVYPAKAQDNPVQPLEAPPPPKVVSRSDRSAIDATKDAKGRIRTTIELSEVHLLSAESLTTRNDYDRAAVELGNYAALIEDALSYLGTMSRDRNKTRDLYKRLELALRAHGPRLTSMRRSTPLEYAYWIKGLEEFARKGRTEALNSFYGHTVFREQMPKPQEEKKPNKPNDSPPNRERKPQ